VATSCGRIDELPGHVEGRKDRPCVILIAAERQQSGDTVVVALPVTHRPPEDAIVAVEIPQAVKQQLGLDFERSWVIVNEGNQFVWLGYDLRKIPGRDEFHYGFLPPRFFDHILAAARAYRKHRKMTMTPR
jgi:hypothetical protein